MSLLQNAAFSASLIVLGIGLSAIVSPIKKLGEMSVEQLVSSVAGIGVVILSIRLMMNEIEDMPKIGARQIATLGAMVIIVGIISLILDLLTMMDTGAALQASAALSLLLLSTSAALAILTAIPAPAAMSAVGSLAAVIAGMAAIVAAAGAIAV